MASDDLINQQLGQYEIRSLIGRGGMATVYLARQTSMDREVAIKVMARELANDEQFVTRFENEAQVIARLQHPHILPVIDFGREAQHIFIVMRLVRGGSLDDRLKEGPLVLDRASRMLDQIASALTFAHEQGIIHRDLKPNNVLLDERDNAYLTDFGIAKMLAGTTKLTATGNILGTPSYMAPEQWRGDPVDARTDTYSLGVMLYEMVLGRLPFSGDTPYTLMYKHFNDAPPPPREHNPALAASIEAVIMRGLAKEADARYQSADALAEDFANAVRGLPVSERRAQPLVPGLDETVVGDTPTPQPAIDDEAPTLQPQTPRPATPPGVPAPQPPPPTEPAQPAARAGLQRWWIVLAALVLAAVIVGGAWALFGDEDDDQGAISGADRTATAVAARGTLTAPVPTTGTATSEGRFTVLAVLTEYATVHSGPGRDYPEIGTLSRDEEIQALGVSDDGRWYQVLYGRNFGWVDAAVVRRTGPDVEIVAFPTRTPTPRPDADDDGVPDGDDRCPDEPGAVETDGCPDADGDDIPDIDDRCPDDPGPLDFDGCPDTDGDDIPDIDDQCPDDPGPLDFDGCPDTDGDDIPDIDDQCPDVPGPLDTDGCPPDSDGDGVPDERDACRDTPGLPSLDGCPPDSDGDDIPDIDDRCPDDPGPLDTDGCPDTDGDDIPDIDDQCPDVPGPLDFDGCPDTDGDGIPIPADQCPDVPGVPDFSGCPPDSDGDGVPDERDACRDTPGLPSLDGCPVADGDGDGFPDEYDACPDEPGTIDGCPDSDQDGLIDNLDACPDVPGLLDFDGCPPENLYQFVTSDPDFSLMAEMVEVIGLGPGLGELDGVTLFLPTDAALGELLENEDLSRDEFLADVDTVEALVLYHLAEVPVTSDMFDEADILPTLLGPTLQITREGDMALVNDIPIVMRDIRFDNDVLHVIDGVLVPVVQDIDNDGLSDVDDACPDQPGPVALDGCPPDADSPFVPELFVPQDFREVTLRTLGITLPYPATWANPSSLGLIHTMQPVAGVEDDRYPLLGIVRGTPEQLRFLEITPDISGPLAALQSSIEGTGAGEIREVSDFNFPAYTVEWVESDEHVWVWLVVLAPDDWVFFQAWAPPGEYDADFASEVLAPMLHGMTIDGTPLVSQVQEVALFGIPLRLADPVLDRFDTNENDWQYGLVEGDVLRMENMTRDLIRWTFPAGLITPGPAFFAQVTGTIENQTNLIEYGLAFRVLDDDSFYYFTINRQQDFGVFRFDDGDASVLLMDTYDGIRIAGENTLGLLVIGDYMELYINGELVGWAIDHTFSDGDLKIAAYTPQPSPETYVVFDDFAYLPLEVDDALGLAANTQAMIGRTPASGAAMRTSYDPDAAILGEIPADQPVVVLGRAPQGDQVFVYARGVAGWIMLPDLDLTRGGEPFDVGDVPVMEPAVSGVEVRLWPVVWPDDDSDMPSMDQPGDQGLLREGRIIEATLPDTDTVLAWRFEGAQGDVVTLALEAVDNPNLDTLLTLRGPDGSVLVEDDDSGTGLFSRIADYTLPADGMYVVEVSSLARSGSFTLIFER